MKAIVVFIAVLFFLHFANPAFATGLIINEFSSASNPEWVEIYNSDEQTYSLQNVILFFDGTSVTQKVSFCDNDQILAKSFKLITRPSNSYWLSNSGDTLILKKEDDVIDSISYGSGQSPGASTSTQSASRIPDGGSWVLSNSPSPQGDEASFVCPTPTTPTNTPTPIPMSAPTSTPTPTKTPTPTPTPTLKLTVTPTPKILQDTLGESTVGGEVISSADTGFFNERLLASNKPKETNNNWLRVAFMLIGIAFIACCAILTFRDIKKRKIMQDE